MRLVTVAGGALVLAGLALVGFGATPPASAASARAPFSDPSAVGYIGLCNEAGQQITSGNINTTPFAWRAVSSQRALAPYNDSWRTAILLAYQPRPGLVASEWSGDELTASANYTNASHPMAAATGGDDSLEDFIQEFQPVWDGYLQLRMYLGTRDVPVYSQKYPALDIQVSGNTWHAVGGGPVDCRGGRAESIESVVLPKTDTTSPPTTLGSGGHAGGALGSHRSALPATPGGPGGHSPLIIAVIAALVVIATFGVVVARRSRHVSHPPVSGSTRHTS